MNDSIRHFRARLAALAASTLCFAGCMTDEKLTETAPDKGYVFAVTSDAKYKEGNYSAVGLDSSFTRTNIDPIHPDAAVRFFGGDDIFVINRLGRDNLQIIDKQNLKTVMQVGFPKLSNPYDVAIKDGLIYVALFAKDSILIYDQKDGSEKGAIDVHAYADSDGFAEATALKFVGEDLYAILANLDSKAYYAPTAKSTLVKIDVKAKKVAKALELSLGNPAGITYDETAGKLYIPCIGKYTESDFVTLVLDGGILSVDLATFAEGSMLATEKDLGGNVGKTLLYQGKLLFDLGVADGERILAYGISDKQITDIVKLNPYKGGGMAVDPGTRTLCIGDRMKGLRLFNLEDFKEKTASNIDLGLLPSDLAVIR